MLEHSSIINSKITPKIKIFGLKDSFIDKYGNQEELLKYSGLDVKNLVKKILIFLGKK